jgi:transcription-repair coupling factor (superfamily II helicase)
MVLDLFQLIRIRWMASELLIDKIQFKGNLFKMYFPGIKTESFYQGPAFEKILAFTQKFPYRCQLSEKNQRRWLEVKMVPDVHEACQIMKLILGESKASV